MHFERISTVVYLIGMWMALPPFLVGEASRLETCILLLALATRGLDCILFPPADG